MNYFYLLLIIAIGHNCFDLLDVNTRGVFRLTDVGIGLIIVGLIFYVFKKTNLNRLNNFFSWFVFVYLLIVLMQAGISSFLYSQSVLSGIIQGRHQFYYLAFPLFLLALDNEKKINNFMTIFSLLSVLLIILSLINYFGPTIFYHKYAEGHGQRLDIVRAYIPGLNILTMSSIWLFHKYLSENKLFSISLIIFLFIFAGIVFAQTRAILISSTFVIFLMLVLKKRMKLMIFLIPIFFLLVSISSLFVKQNLAMNLFKESFTDVKKKEGTWKSRLEQSEDSIKIFKETMWFGSGGIALRDRNNFDLLMIASSADLGYVHWIKFYGLPGIFLLGAMVIAFYKNLLKALASSKCRSIAIFSGYHFTLIIVAGVTQNYFTTVRRILLLCLTWALLMYAVQEKKEESG